MDHSVQELVSQRIYGLALGYEDLNDHEQLRQDPLLRVLAGKADVEDSPLAGKSTLNRLEMGAGIVGPVQSARIAPGFHQRVHAVPVRRRDGDADSAQALVETGQTAGKLLPRVAAVRRAEQSAARPGELPVLPWPLPRLPQHRLDNRRVARIERQIHRARVLILI